MRRIWLITAAAAAIAIGAVRAEEPRAGAAEPSAAAAAKAPSAPVKPVSPLASHASTKAAPAVSFTKHVIPTLTKIGCNSGPCHGAASGKNGFSLTLRGYDPQADYYAITRQAAGRRVNKLEPARSLLLLKPTEVVPHMGGKRFEVGSPEYETLAIWLSSGMPGPSAADPTLVGIDVTPRAQTLRPGGNVQLAVKARWSDGTVEDVTRLARYGSGDESVLQVDDKGKVTVRGHGETAATVTFMTGVALARVRSPFPHTVPPEVYARAERYGTIDELVLAKLQQLNIRPAPLCTDEEFIRRAYLDAAGILPTRAEVERFLADKAPGREKRARLVAAIAERPEYVDYWAYKWSDLLLVSSNALGRNGVRAFYDWIRSSVEVNVPWDRFVYELTTARGRTDQVGAANYFLIHRNPIDLSENYTQAFLGLTLTCARCHNHPMEKWTQRDYYQFANLFARVGSKADDRAFLGKGDTAIVFSAVDGEILHPRLGVAQPPRPLDGVAMAAHDPRDRREYLAKWLTSPANTQFARTIVNRVWANFFGRGLAHPVDDLRETNPVSNEELLTAVTADFVRSGFDIKRLVRTIMASAAYQRSSATDETSAVDDRYYSHYLPRRLPAEVILDAYSQVTGVPERFEGYPAGTRSLQLPDTRIDSRFLTVFGRPERVITSAAERMQDPTLPQALHAINGGTLNVKLMDDAGRIAALASSGVADEEVVDEIYLSALGRRAGPSERQAILAALAGAGADRRKTIEDLAWAVLTSREFLFNH
jgi:hypothetical protein